MSKEDKNHDSPRMVFFKNFDYTDDPEPNATSPGGGLFHGRMDKFKSVEEFLKYKRNKRRKKAILEIYNKYVQSKENS